MEVEDSSEEEDFQRVGRPKRRKTGGVVVDDGQVEQNLLNKNKFTPLGEQNNNNNNGIPVVPAAGQSTGGEKQPPLVVKNVSCGTLRQVMSTCAVKPVYKLTRFGTKIICITAARADIVQAHLLKNNVEFYTFTKKSERPHRVVLRGLPPKDPKLLKEVLKDRYKLEVLEVYAIRRKESSTVEETPYIVLFPKGHTNLQKLREIKRIKSMEVRWEAYRNKKPIVTQCSNCLHLGHGSRNCHLKERCRNCGGAHTADECQVQEAQPKRCANCAGPHGALDRSCPKRAEFIRRRQQTSKPMPPVQKTDKRGPQVPVFNAADFPPLPGTAPVVEPSTSGGQPHSGGPKKQHPRPAGSNETNPRTGVTLEEKDDVLYSSAELWNIYIEFSARLKRCKTKAEQGKVVAFLLFKFEVD